MELGGGFGELVGNDARHGVGGSEERQGDLRRVADHHGDRHGLADCPAEAEDDRAENSRFAVREDRHPDHFPAGCPQGYGGLLLALRHGQEHLLGDGGDDRHHHDHQDEHGGEHAHPVGCTREEREKAEVVVQERLDGPLQPGSHDQHPPEAVDDARDRGEELNQGGDQPPHFFRRDLGDEDGGADREGGGEQERQDGGNHRAPEVGEGAEIPLDRIPVPPRDESPTEPAHGGKALPGHFDYHQQEDDKDGESEQNRKAFENKVAGEPLLDIPFNGPVSLAAIAGGLSIASSGANEKHVPVFGEHIDIFSGLLSRFPTGWKTVGFRTGKIFQDGAFLRLR